MASPQVTAITFKRDVKVLDIYSTKMLGAYGFLARVFGDFEQHKLSVDMLASSEVSVSVTLDKKQKMESIRELVSDMSPYAEVTLTERRSILTLIADVTRSSEVLATVFQVFAERGIQIKMMSQGASKGTSLADYVYNESQFHSSHAYFGLKSTSLSY